MKLVSKVLDGGVFFRAIIIIPTIMQADHQHFRGIQDLLLTGLDFGFDGEFGLPIPRLELEVLVEIFIHLQLLCDQCIPFRIQELKCGVVIRQFW